MARLYLVRHGKAAASYAEHRDPGLDPVVGMGQAETVAARLAPLGPLQIISSPMQRARETAAPLARLWGVAPLIEPRISEIPAPVDDPVARAGWLREAMKGTWSALGPLQRQWRLDVLAALKAITADTVLFSHYVPINAAAGATQGTDAMRIFAPDYCSVTIIENDAGELRLVELGHAAETKIL